MTRYFQLSVFACFLLLAAVAFADPSKDNPPRPSPVVTIYHEGENTFTDWLIEHWKAANYSMPQANQMFCWTDYLVSVPDAKPQKFDMVFWLDKDGDPNIGLVVELLDDDSGVAVETPLDGGFMMIIPVQTDQVRGYLRPKKLKPIGAQLGT